MIVKIDLEVGKDLYINVLRNCVDDQFLFMDLKNGPVWKRFIFLGKWYLFDSRRDYSKYNEKNNRL
jgi:hypothetical protein